MLRLLVLLHVISNAPICHASNTVLGNSAVNWGIQNSQVANFVKIKEVDYVVFDQINKDSQISYWDMEKEENIILQNRLR